MWWQATKWPSPCSFSLGSSLLHRSVALGHLGWNLHPDGGSMGVGTSPLMIALAYSIWGSGTGTAAINATV